MGCLGELDRYKLCEMRKVNRMSGVAWKGTRHTSSEESMQFGQGMFDRYVSY